MGLRRHDLTTSEGLWVISIYRWRVGQGIAEAIKALEARKRKTYLFLFIRFLISWSYTKEPDSRRNIQSLHVRLPALLGASPFGVSLMVRPSFGGPNQYSN